MFIWFLVHKLKEGRAQVDRELEQAKQLQAEMRETMHQLQVQMQAKERECLEQLSLQACCMQQLSLFLVC